MQNAELRGRRRSRHEREIDTHARREVQRSRAEYSQARLWIMLCLSGLVIYGSLYPFEFSLPPTHGEAWLRLVADWSPITSKADALGNLALFVPFGFVGAFARRRADAGMMFALGVAAFILATAVQMAQIYVPARSPAMGDVVWNMVGTGIGMAVALWLGGRVKLDAHAWEARHVLPSGLLALWVLAELVPFVPSLDFGSLRASLKALAQPSAALDQVLFHASGVAVAGWALGAMFGARAQAALLALLAAIAAGKVLVVTQTLDASVFVGLVLGAIGWRAVARWRTEWRDAAVLAVLLLTYVVGALAPFEFSDVAKDFSWLPFEGTLRGSMLVNSKALVANAFLFAAILGLIRANRVSPVAASIGLALLVALFEAAQMYIHGRSADSTEPLIVLLIGQLLRMAPPLPAAAPTGAGPRPAAPYVPMRLGAGWALGLAVTCIAMACAMAMVLRLPQIPYNVTELFRRDAAWYVLLTFSLVLLWIGAGGRLVGSWAARSAHPWLMLPLAAFGACLVSYFLLYYSVTQESLGDIAGWNDLYRRVTAENTWGDTGRAFFLWLDSPELVAFFEQPVRYSAVYAPVVTFLALMFAVVDMRERQLVRAHRILPLAVSAALWLWLCGAIAFLWPTTDNLTELIADGGLPYLYALLAVIGGNAVMLARLQPSVGGAAVAASFTAALLGVGWWLLNQGLEAHVKKEELGVTFSAVQFLLGPDRTRLLPPETLFMRWVAVQLAAVLALTLGARFAEPVARR